ncbi:hypothetical protein PAXINDRAFT_9313 [Paxillus involutus ATCC 200175]|nr:hypothetical protein PAXINDRAFT_9313 [Paxillus involutus ATCC 200175]
MQMGNRRISNDIEECALHLWEIGWTIEDISFALNVSRSSLYRWEALFNELGAVARPPSPLQGPTQILTRALLTACEELYAQESDLYLDKVVTWLALVHDIEISPSTLSRNLKEAGLTRKILHKLTVKRDEDRRNEWREMVVTELTPDGSQVICVDETSKNELTWARHYGRAMSGTRATLSDVFVWGDRYSLVATITIDGYLAAAHEPSRMALQNLLLGKTLNKLIAWSILNLSKSLRILCGD